METIFEYAQSLVYTLLGLMPSPHQRSSLEALLGLFLQAQGQAVPAQSTHKSASALSRFLNRYDWSTRGVIRATRQAMLKQILGHLPPGMTTLKVIIDLTTLLKCGKFAHLATVLKSEMGDDQATVQTDPWVRVLNGKRGLHLVMLYLVVGQWRVPWSFCLWHWLWAPQSNPISLHNAARPCPQDLDETLPRHRVSRYRVWHRRVSPSGSTATVASGRWNARQPSDAKW